MTTYAAPRPVAVPKGAAVGVAAAAPPPLRLPGQHFTVALAYFVCGALGLVFVAPDLAAGAFYLPRVVAVVHCFTLGWLILSIFGALCQFLPVAVGRSIRWRPLAHVTFGLQALGVLLFVAALLANRPRVMHVGAALLSAAFVLFAANLQATLIGVKERTVTWWALSGASLFLVVTPIYGCMLALNLESGVLGAERFSVVARHAHVATVGVVLLVMVGVAHRLLPMFLLSHGAKERAGWAAVAFLFSGASLLALPIAGPFVIGIAFALVSAGIVAFLVQAASFFRHGKRRRLDPGMRLARAGLVGLALALLIAPFALSQGLRAPQLLVAYHVVLLGALSLFVAGHYYKIVPFLVWYHRFGPLVGVREVPKVSELFSERAAFVDAALLVAGWLGLVVGVSTGSPLLTRVAAIGFALGVTLEVALVARIAGRKPA